MEDRYGPVTRESAASRRAPVILEILSERYLGGHIELDYTTPFELLVATILSAQSTDKKINEITPGLFAAYPTPEAYLAAPEEEIQRDIFQTGFYRQKTKAILGVAAALLERFGGEVPMTMKELLTLPGVARKTANVVLSGAAPEAVLTDPDAGIAVDTHVQRLAKRWALTKHDDPVKIERDLMKVWPRERWGSGAHVTILHGRRVCDALRPACGDCVIEALCPSSLIAGKRDRAKQARGLGTAPPPVDASG